MRIQLALRTFASIFALIASPAMAGDAEVSLADGRTLTGITLRPGTSPTQVILEKVPGGTASRNAMVSVTDLLAVDFGKVAGKTETPTVRLVNGDTLRGTVTFPSAKSVKVSAGWANVTVPLGWVSAIRIQEKVELPAPVTKDTVVLTSDRIQGPVQGVVGGKLQVEVGGRPVPVDLARVQSIALANRAPTESRPGTVLSLDMGGGDRLTARWVKLDQDVLTVKLDWGQDLDVPIGSISRMEIKNGKLVYLSDLKPAEVKETPFLDSASPFKVNKAVSGRPIRLRGKAFRRGLGVHSRSSLTYTLDGGFESFKALAGLDDSVGPQGSVIFRIYGDDKLIHESAVQRGGDTPLDLNVPIKGVLLLRIEVDFADNGDAADHANWAEARLLRP